MKPFVFLSFLLIAALLLFACDASQAEPKYTVGVVILLPAFEDALEGVKAGLNEMGYIEGENITFLYDGALGSLEAVEAAVDSYIEADVDAIISFNTPPTQIVKEATTGTGIPVVFGATDPVGAGLVESLAHPGSNLTGVATGLAEDVRLEWLLRVAPGTQKVYVPYNPNDRSAMFALGMVTAAAENLGVEMVTPQVYTTEDVIQAVENIPPDIDAIFLLPDSLVAAEDTAWFEATLERNLPLSNASSPPTRKGELLSYSFTFFDSGKQLSRILDQVLKGVDPGDLPVETNEFYLGVNLQTAEAIGLEIPDEIILVADYVIRE